MPRAGRREDEALADRLAVRVYGRQHDRPAVSPRPGKLHVRAPSVILRPGRAPDSRFILTLYQSLRKSLHGVEAAVGGREPAIELAGTYLQRVAEAPCKNFRNDQYLPHPAR